MRTAWFTPTAAADQEGTPLTSERVTVLGHVDITTYDHYDVGSLWHVQYDDGRKVDAFDDELTDWDQWREDNPS